MPETPNGAPRNTATAAWSFAAWTVLAALIAIVFATFRDYGISWDEMLQNTYGEKLLHLYATGFKDKSAFTYVNLYLYGGLFDILAAALNKVSPFGIYETRHLLGGLVFAVGLIGGWRLANLLAGPRAAFIALIALATTPLLYGHSFINPKDSPFAWLCLWTAYYACRILATPERVPVSARFGFAVSLGLALGARVMAVALLAYLGAVLLAYVLLKPGRASWREAAHDLWRLGWPVAAGLPLSVLVMAMFWPWSVLAPLNLVAALQTFSHFTWQPFVLWSGEMVSAANLPRAYLTQLLLVQLPEYILVGAILAVAAGARALSVQDFAWTRTAKARQIAFVILTIAVPLLAFTILRPVVYNGVRHFLFVVPPLVILAALGLDAALNFAGERSRAAVAVCAGVLALAFAREAATLADLHPYEYVSYNAFTGGIAGAEKRFELDYWGTSLAAVSRGLSAYITATHSGPARVFVCGDRMSAAYFLPPTVAITGQLMDADFYAGINDPPCRDHFDNPPRPVVAVQRDGVTLGYALDLRGPKGSPPKAPN